MFEKFSGLCLIVPNFQACGTSALFLGLFLVWTDMLFLVFNSFKCKFGHCESPKCKNTIYLLKTHTHSRPTSTRQALKTLFTSSETNYSAGPHAWEDSQNLNNKRLRKLTNRQTLDSMVFKRLGVGTEKAHFLGPMK